MTKENPNVNPQVVVGAAGHVQKKRRIGRYILPSAIAVTVIVIAVVGYVLWYVRSKQSTQVTEQPVVTKMDMINNSIVSGDYEGATKAITENPQFKDSRDGKMLLASIAADQGKHDEAIKMYTEIAQKFGWTSNLAHLIAEAYVRKGDKQQAIAYYQKEIEQLDADKTNPTRDAEKEDVQKQIQELSK